MTGSESYSESHESILLTLVDAARNGSTEMQERLMGQLRTYFHLLVQGELGSHLQPKVGHSDIVQESCLCVIEGIDQFRGTTEGELRNWLHRILVNQIRQADRGWRTAKRDVRREIRLDGDGQDSCIGIQPADQNLTPRAGALAREQEQAIHAAMERMPKDYQQVIHLRSWDGLTFPQIAGRLDKSINAVEKLWYRAIQRLRRELAQDDESRQ